jgi:glycosyltransferase involved in cell wall biosynthesis
MAECDKWKTGCHHCPQLKTDNVSWFFDRTSALWKEKKRLFEAVPRLAVVGVSEWTKEQGEKSFLSCADYIERIYNWIDLNVFYPRENREELKEKLGITDKKVVLGVASGWSNAKGLDKFCHLAESLGDEYAVVLVGQMQDAYRLPSNVIAVPPTTSTDLLAEYYSMADVFVSLSLQETFGKVSAEALACGTPIVCFDSTANKEMVGDNSGKTVAPNDLDGIIDAVEKICKKDKQEYMKRCRQFAATHFDKEKNIVSYLQLFEKLTADKE